jgi:hypothetical protein
MCGKCKEFDEKIAHYRRIGVYIADELTLAAIKQLIDKASAGKAALHPEGKK